MIRFLTKLLEVHQDGLDDLIRTQPEASFVHGFAVITLDFAKLPDFVVGALKTKPTQARNTVLKSFVLERDSDWKPTREEIVAVGREVLETFNAEIESMQEDESEDNWIPPLDDHQLQRWMPAVKYDREGSRYELLEGVVQANPSDFDEFIIELGLEVMNEAGDSSDSTSGDFDEHGAWDARFTAPSKWSPVCLTIRGRIFRTHLVLSKE